MKKWAYSITVHIGHEPFHEHLLKVGEHFDDGLIDYAIYCVELSKNRKIHLQGFIVFNESLEKRKPTEVLNGSFQKAKSLTGLHDYISREGIHYMKGGIIGSPIEFGKWVDAGFNINIKFRKQYQFAKMIERGWAIDQIAAHDPAGVLIVGQRELKELSANLAWAGGNKRRFEFEPYCYIGLGKFQDYLRNEVRTWEVYLPSTTEEE